MIIQGQSFTELTGKLKGYWVSRQGLVASTKPTGRFKDNKCRDLKAKENHILKQRLNRHGYYDVGLRFINTDGERKKIPYQVHRLVALTYLMNDKNLPQVNHIDGIRTNNRVDNLEWCTAKYNVQDGVKRKSYSKKGQTNACAKLKDWQIPIIMDMRKKGTYVKDIGDFFNVSKSTIQNIVSGYQWNHITGLPNKRDKYKSRIVNQYES